MLMRNSKTKKSTKITLKMTPKMIARSLRWRELVDHGLCWLRSCAICHSFVPPIDLLCAGCWQRLSEEMNREKAALQTGYPFPVYSLFTWTPKNDHLIRPFIYAFKGGRAFQATNFFIEQLSLTDETSEIEPPVFVYPPPTIEGTRDHSWLIAQKLARHWETKAFELSKAQTTDENQKVRSARERSQRRFRPLEIESLESVGFSKSSLRWVFVDDVITTGSTAMAAYMALEDPNDFEVWTLVARPKLADSKGL